MEYCSAADTKSQCEEVQGSWRSLHCTWNVDKYEMVFDEKHEENNDEDYVAEVSDELAVWLKTPNAKYKDVPSLLQDKLETTK